jgi:hypothetical protein
MKIYVASSWRNEHQKRVVRLLRMLGHQVYDFREPESGTGFSWEQCGLDPKPLEERRRWSAELTRRVLTHPVARAGYASDIGALRSAEAVVYVLPCGKSASWELGYAMGAGKPGFVFQPEDEEPELMFSECTILGSYKELADNFNSSLQAFQ